ncbi:hypothetical protein [Rhodoglobus aureus]
MLRRTNPRDNGDAAYANSHRPDLREAPTMASTSNQHSPSPHTADTHDGGNVVFEGTPAVLIAGKSTLTGEHLAAYVTSRN